MQIARPERTSTEMTKHKPEQAHPTTDSAWSLIVGVAPSVVDLRSAFALLCTAKSAHYTDLHWGALAVSYCPVGFWEAAATRPKSSSKPLLTWRAELERLVKFDAMCVRLNGSKMELYEYVDLWAMLDRTAVEFQRASVGVATETSSSVDNASLCSGHSWLCIAGRMQSADRQHSGLHQRSSSTRSP